MTTAFEKRGDAFLMVQNVEGCANASRGVCTVKRAHLNGAVVNAVTVGGVGTEPEYRRMGLVKKFLAEVEKLAAQENCPITVLHPFSFSYYRKYGFERVADHRILEMPVGALDFVPRYEKLHRCTAADTAQLDAVYNAFAKERNLMFARDGYSWPVEDATKRIYLSCDENGHADGYILYELEKPIIVNHWANCVLHVHELVFTTPAALDKLFGFMRMFDGEVERIKLHNVAMAPEIEHRLRHYTQMDITVIPDLMVRINDVEAVLRAVHYPQRKGSFTVKVTERDATPFGAPKTNGVWRVVYENGAAQVVRLAEDAAADLVADLRAFTQIVFGYESIGAQTARYMHDVELVTDCEDLFCAFPNRPCSLFEHF